MRGPPVLKVANKPKLAAEVPVVESVVVYAPVAATTLSAVYVVLVELFDRLLVIALKLLDHELTLLSAFNAAAANNNSLAVVVVAVVPVGIEVELALDELADLSRVGVPTKPLYS